jgi:hypothetical protein
LFNIGLFKVRFCSINYKFFGPFSLPNFIRFLVKWTKIHYYVTCMVLVKKIVNWLKHF